jgi:nucleotide-binding universal stress UspA family protein
MKDLILIATNGFSGTWPAVQYGSWVAETLDSKITLLGVEEGTGDQTVSGETELDRFLEKSVALLKSRGQVFSVERQRGRSESLVPQAASRAGGITVLGPLGRPLLRRLLVGRSIRSLLEAIETPVIYVPQVRLPLSRLLICVGGLGYDITAEHIALRIGKAAGAEVTLLHVAPPVNLDYPTARAEIEHWQDIETADGLIGRNIRRALETAKSAGLSVNLKTRQGDVVEEIVSELKSGGYDLISMGSPHGIGGLRQLYEPNVTDEVVEHAQCPVLSARHRPPAA